MKLENVEIANALQLEAARRRAVPIRFNSSPAAFEVAQPIRCRLTAYLMLIHYVELWPRDLDRWPLTLNLHSVSSATWRNSVRNLSEIEQSAAELLQFEYLTLWPWTCITCSAMLWDSLHNKLSQLSYPFMKCNDFFTLIRHVTLWPVDLESLWYFRRHVFKLCIKFEQNRTIRCRVIDDLAHFRRKIFNGVPFTRKDLRDAWTELHQTWRRYTAIISAHQISFRVEISCCIFKRRGLKVWRC